MRAMPPIEKTCQVCEKPFRVYPYRAIVAKFCSYACSGKSTQTKVERQCRNCGSLFSINLSQFQFYKGAGKYCSLSCKAAHVVAETAVKPIKDRYGRSRRKADLNWQRAVRDRDGNACQRCGKVEKYVHTHHVAPRSRRPDLKHDVSNGICLCNSCHTYVHNHVAEATELGFLSTDSYELARKEANVSTN